MKKRSHSKMKKMADTDSNIKKGKCIKRSKHMTRNYLAYLDAFLGISFPSTTVLNTFHFGKPKQKEQPAMK